MFLLERAMCCFARNKLLIYVVMVVDLHISFRFLSWCQLVYSSLFLSSPFASNLSPLAPKQAALLPYKNIVIYSGRYSIRLSFSDKKRDKTIAREIRSDWFANALSNAACCL